MSNIKEGFFITPKQNQKFKIWLVKNELSINGFAKKIGVSHQYISNILNGKAKFTESVKAKFEQAGCNLF